MYKIPSLPLQPFTISSRASILSMMVTEEPDASSISFFWW